MTWKNVNLGEIIDDIQPGFAQRPNSSDKGVPQLRPNNVSTQGAIDLTDLVFVEIPRGNADRYTLRKDDVVFNNTNSSPLVGKTALFELDAEYTFSNHMTRIRGNNALIRPAYLAYFLHEAWRQGLSRRRAKEWVSQSAVDQTTLVRFVVPLPPTSEQERIVSILKQAETVRTLRNSAYEKAKKIISTLYQETFLSHSERKTWPVVTIGEAGQVQLGRQRAPQHQTGRYSKPYLRVANVLEDELDLSDETSILEMDFDNYDFNQYKLEFGDILLNEGQSAELVGRAAMWRNEITDCCFQNTLIRFRSKDNIFPEYALYTFLWLYRQGVFKRISAQTSNLAHLSADRFAKLPFAIPPLELQRDFVKKVDAVRRVVQAIEEKTKKMEDTFRGLTASAFAGKLTEAWRKKPDVAPILNQQAAERDALLDGAATEPAETTETATVKITDLSTPSQRKEVAAEIVRLFESGSSFAFQLEEENEATPVQWRDMVRRVLDGVNEDAFTDRLLYLQDAVWDIAQPEMETVGDELSTLESIGAFSPDSPTHPRAMFWQEVAENSPLRTVYNAFHVSPGEGYNNLQTILEILEELGEPLEEYKVQQALTTLESAGLIYDVVLEVATSRGANADTVRLEAYRLPLGARGSRFEQGTDQS